MGNSSWAYNFEFSDKTKGEILVAPVKENSDCLRVCIRSYTKDSTQKSFEHTHLPESEVRKLVSAMQAWLGERADARAEEAAKKGEKS